MAMTVALIFAGLLTILGVYGLQRQRETFARLRDTTANLPNDERAYLYFRARRRTISSVLLLLTAGLLAWTYLSGQEERAREIGDRREQAAAGQKPELTAEEKEFAREWAVFWIVILLLLFALVLLAFLDLLATRKHAWAQITRIREDHRVLLERDIAVYKEQRRKERLSSQPNDPR